MFAFRRRSGTCGGRRSRVGRSRFARTVASLAIPSLLTLPALAALPDRAAAQETHVLTVVGLGGDPALSERFFDWGATITTAVRERFGIPAEHAVLLSEDEDDPAPSSGEARRESVEAAIRDIAARSTGSDRVLVVLIGHGTFRNEEARFNLPGPDMTASEWDALLDELAPRRVAVVNASSASGPFLQALAGIDRTVITATKTGRQRNLTVFGEYFASAFEGDAADLDKDGALSLLEAFSYATAEVERHYEELGQLATETPVLDDDGDGVGSEEPAIDLPDGALAASFVLVPARALALTPEMQADSVLVRLMGEQAELERRVAQLRARRSEMDPESYDLQLEELLVELALKNREVEARRGGGGG